MGKTILKEFFFSKTFRIPLVILVGIIIYSGLQFLHIFPYVAVFLIIAITLLGSFDLVKAIMTSLLKKQFALDYIAIIAIAVGLLTQEYLVAALLALMISSGRTLEEYAVTQAKKSLTKLSERIPHSVTVITTSSRSEIKPINSVQIGEIILVRKGEVIPLDGVLISPSGLTDESLLTGEPYFIDKLEGDLLRSGTINMGEPMHIRVIHEQNQSTYTKILEMVEKAQNEKAPLIRMADAYSTVFTLITFLIAGLAFLYAGFDWKAVLAVLAIATPCPLIIATPIALIGGVNVAAKKRIIVKKLASLEMLAKTSAVIFDKTGTITLGIPRLTTVTATTGKYTEIELLGIAESIERHSLHPLAKAIVMYSKEKDASSYPATVVKEEIGKGITGTVNGKVFTLSKVKEGFGMTIGLYENDMLLALFLFEEEIKQDSKTIIKYLKSLGLQLFIFTGDKKEAALRVVEKLGENVTIKAECTPEDKLKGIETLRKHGKITAMVGDGINDAPALALADVGLVFSNEEQTAASEAADIVFLGGDFQKVLDALIIAKRTIRIAKQSILWGIGMSIVGMILAAFGLIPPLYGAGLQEVIDVVVILNALRSSRDTIAHTG